MRPRRRRKARASRGRSRAGMRSHPRRRRTGRSRAPDRRRLPPGGARLRRRLAPLAARCSPGPYYEYCSLRPRTASDASGARVSFQDASVFVTGGSRGIGREIALRFAAEGAQRVAIGYLRNDKAAERVAEELRARGAEPVLVRGNVASERIAREVAELGPLDALVHNAATGVVR